MADAKGPVFDPMEDLKLLLGFFVLLWLFWFITGGPSKYELAQHPFLRQPTEVGLDQNGVYRDPDIHVQYGEIPTVQVKISRKPTTIVAPRVLSGPIINLSKGQADLFGLSYIKIDYSAINKLPITITGLIMRNILGKSAVIAGASNLPYQGRINEVADVIVGPGSSIYIIQGISPLGVSFRVNKCIGYLAQYQDFYPLLPKPIIDELTYNTCVDAHKTDLDFYTNDWRIYLGTNAMVWNETGDVVRLMNNSGNTLSSIFY